MRLSVFLAILSAHTESGLRGRDVIVSAQVVDRIRADFDEQGHEGPRMTERAYQAEEAEPTGGPPTLYYAATFKEIGDELGVSRERARQMFQRASTKVRDALLKIDEDWGAWSGWTT